VHEESRSKLLNLYLDKCAVALPCFVLCQGSRCGTFSLPTIVIRLVT